jgi:DMSO/TMAO reductase YedYZ molybdopterin-dependent catalytic subunit
LLWEVSKVKTHIARICLILVLLLLAGCQPVVVPTLVATPEPPSPPTPEPAAPPTEVPTPEPAAQPAAESPVVLELVGPGGTQSLTLDDLKALPAVEGWGGLKSSTGEIFLPAQLKGVTLEELVALAGGLSPEAGVSIVARDGYAMTFSYDQIVNGDFITYDPVTGDEITIADPLTAALAYERDGQPLPADSEGPLRVVVLTPKNNQVVDGHWSIKWVNQIVLKSLGQTWTFHAEGAVAEEVDRGTFESCTAPGCHRATWTDERAREWSGVPLWLLLGYVDDEVKHGDDAYLEALAEAGYPVDVVAADGYTMTFDSTRLHHNDNILVADKMNGNPLEDKDFPLRLVGSDLQGNEMVGQIAQILLHLPTGGEAQAEPTPEPTETPTAEPPAPEAPPAGGVALAISGAVDAEQSLSLEALHGLDVVEVTAEHPKKGEQIYTGVRLNDLLDLAGVTAEATSVLFTASDGYQVEIDLAEVQACADCLLAFGEDDTLSLVMPGMESSFWVKDVVEIEVK